MLYNYYLYYHSYKLPFSCYVHLILNLKQKCGGIIFTFYKFKLLVVSTGLIVCSFLVDIHLWGLQYCLVFVHVEHLLYLFYFPTCLSSQTVPRKVVIFSTLKASDPISVVFALEPDLDLLLLMLLLALLSLFCLSYDPCLFLS